MLRAAELNMRMTKISCIPLTRDVVRALPHRDKPYLVSDQNLQNVFVRIDEAKKICLINIRVNRRRLIRTVGEVTNRDHYEIRREQARELLADLPHARGKPATNPLTENIRARHAHADQQVSARAKAPDTPNHLEHASKRAKRNTYYPKLTNAVVEKYQCRPGMKFDKLWCGELRGFHIRVSANGRIRTYGFAGRVKGTKKQPNMKIGRHNDPFRIDQARQEALVYKAKMLKGIDPRDERKQKGSITSGAASTAELAHEETLSDLTEDYLENRTTAHGRLRPATKKDYRHQINVNLAEWARQPWTRITRDMCVYKFRALSARAPTQANKCMRYLRAIINWGREKYSTEDGLYPIMPTNPVTRLFKLQRPNPTHAKQTRIPINKVGACWLWLRQRSQEARTYKEGCAADWVSTLLLSGMRREESASIKKVDVDLKNRTITLHGEVTNAEEGLFSGVKNHNTFILPMSGPLYQIMAQRVAPPTTPHTPSRRRRSLPSPEYVFATTSKRRPYISNADKTFKALSKIAGTHIHPHAVRRTFEDIAQECGIDGDTRRLLLNHAGGDVHATHYANNLRALPEALEKIANWILKEASLAEARATGANVIPLRTGSAVPSRLELSSDDDDN